jgi:hypothetical protein
MRQWVTVKRPSTTFQAKKKTGNSFKNNAAYRPIFQQVAKATPF